MPRFRSLARVLRLHAAQLICSALVLALGPITAHAANHAPAISGTAPPTGTVGRWYNFLPTASDPDGDPIKFSIKNKPWWLVFNTTTGRLSNMPTEANVGSWSNIIISVTDGKATTSLPPFSVTITGSGSTGNHAPKISGTAPPTGTVGRWYNFLPTASDPDGDPIKFSIKNKPWWLVFNTTTGRLSNMPTEANVGSWSNIIISVTDGKATTSLPPFSVTITGSGSTGNHAPKIAGTAPPTGTVGRWYNFLPTASDPDGDPIKFSIKNKPWWLVFNTTTGRLSNMPTEANVGSWSNIIISVTDGKATTSLPPFSVTITGSGSGSTSGSATLSWTPPTENTNGTALTNLAGYRIYYGTSPSALTRTIQVTNPGISRYVVENLASATWYFSVRAYTSTGVESAPSKTASKTIP